MYLFHLEAPHKCFDQCGLRQNSDRLDREIILNLYAAIHVSDTQGSQMQRRNRPEILSFFSSFSRRSCRRRNARTTISEWSSGFFSGESFKASLIPAEIAEHTNLQGILDCDLLHRYTCLEGQSISNDTLPCSCNLHRRVRQQR